MQLQWFRPAQRCAAVRSGAVAVATKPGATVTLATAGGSAAAVVPSRAAVRSGAAAVATKPGATVTLAAAGGSAEVVVPSRAAVRSGAAVSKVGPGAHIRGGHRAQTKVEGQSKDAPRGDWGSHQRKALTGSHRLTRNEIRRSQRNMPRTRNLKRHSAVVSHHILDAIRNSVRSAMFYRGSS